MGFDLDRLDDAQRPEPDYTPATTISELADIVAMSPVRKHGASWADAVTVAEAIRRGDRDPLVDYPFLYGIAAARSRTADPALRAAILRIEQAGAQA